MASARAPCASWLALALLAGLAAFGSIGCAAQSEVRCSGVSGSASCAEGAPRSDSELVMSLLDCNTGDNLPAWLARGGEVSRNASMQAAKGRYFLLALSPDEDASAAQFAWYTDNECKELLPTDDAAWRLWGPALAVGDGECNDVTSVFDSAAGNATGANATNATLGVVLLSPSSGELDEGEVLESEAAPEPRSAVCHVPKKTNTGLEIFGILVAVIIFGAVALQFLSYRCARWRAKRAVRRERAALSAAERHPSGLALVPPEEVTPSTAAALNEAPSPSAPSAVDETTRQGEVVEIVEVFENPAAAPALAGANPAAAPALAGANPAAAPALAGAA